MIYITGDLHGNWTTGRFDGIMTDNDYAIICGDFGLLWDSKLRDEPLIDKFLETNPGTYLFVDGNHENFPLINTYPVEEWNCGFVHRIKPRLLHLMRGQIFDLEDKKIFVMGGGTSIDKEWRIEGLSWWPEEMPNQGTLDFAEHILNTHDWKVDYVFTHEAPDRIHDIAIGPHGINQHDLLTNWLQHIDNKLDYKKWFFGHYHKDLWIDEKHRMLYHDVIPLYEEEKDG